MSDVQGRPASTMSAERRYGIAISVALILGGVYWALTGLTEGTKSGQSTYKLAEHSLVVEGGSISVEIRPGDGDELKIDRQFERNAFGSDPEDSFKDGTLRLKEANCGFLSFNCKTSYVLTVPRDVKLTVKNNSGSVKVSGMTGDTELKTNSGDIVAQSLGGSLRMESSSGSIAADGLTAGKVTTKSSSGSADLEFSEAPQSVDAKSSSGDVTIMLPAGDESYHVETDTSSGDNERNVKVDPGSTRSLKAKTSSGDIDIEYSH
ncbi:hypothetical protein E1263_19390 [Kribbella antibiotica]|uniref:DUF4097 domain-containing protein n=1 Tax=Kribbella antibiotica TaxID=190195 RepID=A0A4R4ZIU9_9ACTN|nr:DUF4097 family beta strand repeat-containing protein [Kribbella antibiotica]TDD58385.1 hypothetical protein E1263_19390 [Kribbella antibiotica]